MIKIIKDNKEFYIGFFFIVIILLTIYCELILNINSHFLYVDGDALKNYFLFATVSKFGNTSNINYPFGESLLYTDSIPLISYSNYLLSKLSILNPKYSIGILHTYLLSIYLISYIYLYKIFRNTNTTPWIAVLGSLIIALGCPSNSRILLHFGLHFIGVFPFLLFQIFNYSKNTPKKNVIIIIFLTSCYYIHGYVGALFSGFTIFYFIFLSLFNKKIISTGISLGLISTFIYTITVYYFDDNLWRSPHPSALFDYLINIKRIIPFTFNRYISIHDNLQLNIWLWILTFFTLLQLKKIKIKNTSIVAAFLSGLVFFIYGTSIIVRFQIVLDLVPQLQQLRDLQRFGWISYFVFTSGSIIYGEKYLNKKILFPILLLGLIESINYQIKIINKADFQENIFSKKNLKDSISNNFKASLFLSSNFKENTKFNLKHNLNLIQYQLSYYYEIPPINNYLSRHSEVEQHIQKQFYIPIAKGVYPTLLSYVNKTDSILLLSNIRNYNYIPIKKLGLNFYISSIEDFLQNPINLDSIRQKADYFDPLTNKSIMKIINDNKDGLLIDQFFSGRITSIPVKSLNTKTKYKLSIWNYNYKQDSLVFDKLVLYQNDRIISSTSDFTKFDIMSNRWGRLNMNFILNNNIDTIFLHAERSFYNSPFIIEKILKTNLIKKKRKQPLIFNELTITTISPIE
ncbi:hypothetical protein EI427_14715 [Flammeovirga pectinis]|uniref:DUF6311 domain-containing protein n=1 Tax=Flammeovirga pectinis TaxID=2494373 RepID=A0A3S9P5F3_9BACT|nr:hypothetical protein [Flammeovirga pectinis]AZQ63437.1 hypothetical protein EI427_14715 [Flammeovirga pectinis]